MHIFYREDPVETQIMVYVHVI